MTSTTTWWAYMKSVIGDTPANKVARKAGFSTSNMTRWKAGERPAPDYVLKFARAYNLDVREALVAAGFITEEESKLTTIEPKLPLSEAASPDLVAEIRKRLDEYERAFAMFHFTHPELKHVIK